MAQKNSLASFSFILGLSQANINTIFATNQCEKCPSSMQCRDSNPQPSFCNSHPIDTRPGLPPSPSTFVLAWKELPFLNQISTWLSWESPDLKLVPSVRPLPLGQKKAGLETEVENKIRFFQFRNPLQRASDFGEQISLRFQVRFAEAVLQKIVHFFWFLGIDFWNLHSGFGNITIWTATWFVFRWDWYPIQINKESRWSPELLFDDLDAVLFLTKYGA